METSAVVRVIEQCCFNSVSDLLIDSITFGGFKMEGSGTLLKQHCSITLVIALVPISEFKPRTSDLRTCLHTHNSLPESQCDGNFELLQLFQPMIDHI